MARRLAPASLLLPLLIGLGCGYGPRPSEAPVPVHKQPLESETVTLPKEVNDALVQDILGPALAAIFVQIYKEMLTAFEITDDLERKLLAMPGMEVDFDREFLAVCVVRPDAAAGRRRLYDYKGWFRYASVSAPAAHPLAVFVARTGGGHYRVVLEASYDPLQGEWVERPGALRDERKEVREAVADAVKRMVPDGVKVAGLP